ncbi:multidrug transporter [Pelistega indica]|uniref:Multidrug transporter n=1 Tax=Pelistega indica TaxID=1414851 RepID=V8GBL6_9BURK|nr:efflux transporter outer membrane subunit [Pelistega indica]ETD73128.1 multidrug transporter [Pelistega indica]
MTKFGRISLLTSSVFLAACNLAPKYETPVSPIAQDSYKYAHESGRTAADIGWENFFYDQRLKALIPIALENNRDLRIAIKNVEAAKAQYGITQSSLFPNIGLSGSESAQKLPADLSQTGSRYLSRSYQAGIGLNSFELDFFGKIRNQTEAALESFYATEQAQRTAYISVVTTLANTYFSLRSLEEMEQLYKDTIASYQASYQLTNARFKAGVASMLDVNQAKSSLESAKASLAQLQRSKEQTKNSLEVILGQEMPASLPKAAPFGSDVMLDTIPAGLPSDLLTRRPDIMADEHNLKAANANIGAARAAFFPSISLTAMFGVASAQLGHLFNSGQEMWSFAPSISLPVFTAGSLQGSLDVAKIRKDIQVATYEKDIQTAFQEVNDALIGVKTYKDQLNALRSQTSAAEQSLKLSTMRYKSGIDSFLQVQSAQVTVLTVKQNFLSVGLESLQNKIALYKALGGGWSATDIVKTK